MFGAISSPSKLAWQKTTLQGPPSTLLEPPSSAHHRLDDVAFSVQPPTTSTIRLWQMIGTFHATCPWQSNNGGGGRYSNMRGSNNSNFQPRFCRKSSSEQSQSVFEWTLEEVKHALHDNGGGLCGARECSVVNTILSNSCRFQCFAQAQQRACVPRPSSQPVLDALWFFAHTRGTCCSYQTTDKHRNGKSPLSHALKVREYRWDVMNASLFLASILDAEFHFFDKQRVA